MTSLRAICRPPPRGYFLPASFSGCRCQARLLGFPSSPSPSRSPNFLTAPPPSSPVFSPLLDAPADVHRLGQRRTIAKASNWTSEKSPYETLELERDADEETIKSAYRRLAKYYHPDGGGVCKGVGRRHFVCIL
ncbi:hypothetical protein Taro_041547 [Colocasia esculenta]|uniref:J domain-containing protein n=1 Tax=Colocasia esculenta TaxID=4460 RepID=A0A843WG51_COLES|nr:hypothetical protein [Colocasia esculenta]